MSCVTIIPTKIDIPDTIIDLLKGVKGLYLQNNIFLPEKAERGADSKLFEIKQICGQGGKGITIKAPRLFVRDDISGFSSRYRLELTSKKKSKETYRFKRPPEGAYPDKAGKCKNIISTKIMERDNEIKALVKIDNLIYMATEYLMLAHFSKHDFKNANTDEELINGLFNTLAPKKHEELMQFLDKDFYKLVTNPPKWTRDETVMGNWFIETKEDNKFLTLFNVIYAVMKNSKTIKPGSLQEEIVKNLFGGKTKGSLLYEFIISSKSNDILPTCKIMLLDFPDEPEPKSFDEMKLMFYIKHNNSKYNPKFPESLYAKEMKKNSPALPLDGNKFMDMIGYGQTDAKTTYYTGFIWVYNQINATKYGLHQCHSDWVVGEILLKKTNKDRALFNIDSDYYDLNDLGGYNDIQLNSDTEEINSEQCPTADELAEELLIE